MLGPQLTPGWQPRLSGRLSRSDEKRRTVTPGRRRGRSCCPVGNEARGPTADLRRRPRGPGRQRPSPWPGGGWTGSAPTQKRTPSHWPPGGEQDRLAGGGTRGPSATARAWLVMLLVRGVTGHPGVQGLRLLLRCGTLGVRTERCLGKPGRLATPLRPRAAGCCATVLEKPPGPELRGDQAAEVGGHRKPWHQEGPHAPGCSLCVRLSRAATPAERVAWQDSPGG